MKILPFTIEAHTGVMCFPLTDLSAKEIEEAEGIQVTLGRTTVVINRYQNGTVGVDAYIMGEDKHLGGFEIKASDVTGVAPTYNVEELIARKRKGEDCTEEESAYLKSVLGDLYQLFPCEFSEADLGNK